MPVESAAFASPTVVQHTFQRAAPRAQSRKSDRTTTMTAFRKYHGLGNDFILIDNRETVDPVLSALQASAICDRNTGVGADGVIFLLPPKQKSSHFSMRLYNSDGTEPEMCGNGIRCLARFASDLGMSAADNKYVVDTLAGEIVPKIQGELVEVDMGAPILNPKEVPTKLNTGEESGWVDTLSAAGRDWSMSCVSMGNPHAITFVSKEEYDGMDSKLEQSGPLFEHHEAFPQRTNTEFVYQRGPAELDMLVWERGAGRTMACGTGACAVVVAAVLTGRAKKDVPVVVHLPGGDLTIKWDSGTDHVIMTGPAELVFEGKLANL